MTEGTAMVSRVFLVVGSALLAAAGCESANPGPQSCEEYYKGGHSGASPDELAFCLGGGLKTVGNCCFHSNQCAVTGKGSACCAWGETCDSADPDPNKPPGSTIKVESCECYQLP